ncbi:MAG: hypothetical protein MN733_12585 [Nitrososphaera sp.]|nr:hypothetical protein [Nitrososphaera sp.]
MQEYEELRRRIMAGKVATSSGLSLLISRGVAAWLQLVSITPSLPQFASTTETVPALPDMHTGIRNEMVSVIANMILQTNLEVAHAV